MWVHVFKVLKLPSFSYHVLLIVHKHIHPFFCEECGQLCQVSLSFQWKHCKRDRRKRENKPLQHFKSKPSQVCMLLQRQKNLPYDFLTQHIHVSTLFFRIQSSPSSSPPSSCGPSPPYFLPLSTTLPSSKLTGPGMVYTFCSQKFSLF